MPFAHGTMLAPMEGVTHPDLRAAFAGRGGLGIVCTEFIRISRAPISAKGIARDVVKAPGVPLSVQVMGNDPEKMAEAAGIVAAAGADVVDVNLGCPAPRVVKKGVGAAMLKDLGLLHEVLASMRSRVPGMLSAKIRAGFDTAEDVVRIGRAVEAAGVDYIVVHPRRRADFFEGVADWRAIRALREALKIPVVGNGDCWYAADALRMEAETGCDAVMIGRPALRNPWIFEQIEHLRAGRAPPRPSGRDVFALVADFAERFGSLGRLKELLSYVGRAVNDDRAFRSAVLRLPDTEQILDYAERALVPLPAEALDLDAEGTLQLERSGRA